MQPDCPSICWLLCRWRDAQKHKSISINVTHGFSNCAQAGKKKAPASAAGWPRGAFKSYFAYSVSQKHTHQISMMSHTKPHDGKRRWAATARVWLRQEMWSTRTGYYSAWAGGEIQTRLTVIGMRANVGLRCRLEASSADGWFGSSEFQVVNMKWGLVAGVCAWNGNTAWLFKPKKIKNKALTCRLLALTFTCKLKTNSIFNWSDWPVNTSSLQLVQCLKYKYWMFAK